MGYVIFVIIVGLVLAVGYLYYQLRLQRHYYEYKADKMDSLETSLKEEQEQHKITLNKLNKVAYINPISKIGNLDYFINEACNQFFDGENTPFTLLVFNISNMGTVNKLFGPTEGDKVIIYSATCLRRIGQNQRFLYAHLYSNLFGALLRTNDRDAIIALTQEITAALQGYNDSFALEPSFGICEITDIEVPVLDLINQAMLAQNLNKNKKECNYNFYTKELNKNFTENKGMSQEMEQAMEQHKFLMYLQPMVDLRTFKISSAEALVRWDHPEKGILSPYAFLPLFEGTSVIEKLDYYMWEECCKTIRRWIDNKIEPTPISMNISPIHFQSLKFITQLNTLTEHYLIDKNLLILELPERGIASGSAEVINIIKTLHENGYILSIDNFGSMYSPLNLMRDLPIASIKIDRSFLNKNTTSDEGLTILRYLIAMAKEVDLSVHVEGVETEEQANFLAEIGADVAQGYFFSKPIDLREFDALNKTMINSVYKSDEYYPTFEDLEKDLDLIDYLLKQA
ncbi:MAG: GGDEF domain-containing protein [Lachnospiraceae bacterium]|nr:GGDEF domain-containing protein [Lachnospiraceae bacterium]